MRKGKDNNENNKEAELTIFSSKEFGQIRTIIVNNEPIFCLGDLCKALELTAKGVKQRLSDEVISNYLIEDSLGRKQNTLFVNEDGLYDVILESRKESARKFRKWVTSDVLPTIRKTGGYVNNDALFIDTYLPFADDNTKLLFSTTLETVRKQNELIKKQQEEILHKQEIINGLTDDVDIYKKKDIINRICRRRHENYANRYKELYKCFRENYHIDLEARCEGYNLKQVKKKDHLTTIKYAEKFGFIDDLYSCCVKLYETEVKEIIEQLNEVHD